jgi:hypothetical protein
MALYHLHIRKPHEDKPSEFTMDCPSRDAAWAELTTICSGLIGDAARTIQQNSEWQIGMLDEAKRPLFRIRLVAESLD